VHAVKIRCLHAAAEIAALRSTINALNLASARPDPFSTFEFYENLLRRSGSLSGGTRSRAWFLAAFSERELIGYLALEEVTDRALWRPIKRLGFLGAHDADRPHVVAKAENIGVVTEMFYEYLWDHRREWDLLELQQQDSASTLYPPPPGVNLTGCRVRHWPNLDNGTIRVRWRTLQEYFDALAPKFCEDFLRKTHKLLASGATQLLTSSDPASTPALLDLYCSIEKRSWKSRTQLTIGDTPERLDYFRALLDARQPMQAAIHVLVLDDVPVAGLISGAFAGPAHKGLYALHIVFDQSLRSAGPGSAILMMGMRYAIAGRFAFFNLLCGFGHDKTRWLADMTATRCAQIYRVGTLIYWRRLLGDAQRWFAARAPLFVRRFLPAAQNRAADDLRQDPAGPELERGAPPVTVAERATFRTLIAEVRRGHCEWLSTAELMAAMPAVAGHLPEPKRTPRYAVISARPAGTA
jgi:GNAT acetyltransferase-like protein